MNILLTSFTLLCLLSLSYGADYDIKEATDDTVKKMMSVQKLNESPLSDIVLMCTFTIQDAANKFAGGAFHVSWYKEQSLMDSPCKLKLNHGTTMAEGLDQELYTHLDYSQGLVGTDEFWNSITIKDARLEDSGNYACELTLQGQDSPKSTLAYHINVLDLTDFEVFIYAADTPMSIPSIPDPESWPHMTSISLRENPDDGLSPQQFSYVACVARGAAQSAMITATIENADDDALDRSVHDNMEEVKIQNGTGDVVCAQKLEVVKVLEDRTFPIQISDDGGIFKCEAWIEDENNQVLKRVEATATLDFMSVPQFMNCSKEAFLPRDSSDGIISCKIKAKPALTGEIIWQKNNEQLYSGDEFMINQKLEGDNIISAELTIARPLENFNDMFTIIVKNSIGTNEKGILLRDLNHSDINITTSVTMTTEGASTGETSDSVIQLSSIVILLLSAVAAILVQ